MQRGCAKAVAIKRRSFLQALGGTAASTLVLGQGRTPSVGVVGGGIIGASIALHLASSGAGVTLFEKNAPATGATGKSFAWINAHTNNPHYRLLRLKSIAAYHELDRELGLNVVWGGAINWATSLAELEQLKASSREFAPDGYHSRIITAADLDELVPGVRLEDFEGAIFNSMDGHIDPVAVTRKLVASAEDRGARVITDCEVQELKFQGDRLSGVTTTKGDYELDRLVIAGGTETPALAAQAGYAPPLRHAPGILMHTTAQDHVLDRVLESASFNLKQNPDGRIVGTDSPYAPDIPVHAAIIAAETEMPAEIQALHGERILGKFREMMPGAIDASFDYLTLGYRPMPQDGMPVAGFSPGNSDVYIAVMHSGVTLAPIMGRYITQELLTDDSIDELAPYRPARFSQ